MARKPMILCGLAPDVDGTWRATQLTIYISSIVSYSLPFFNGMSPFGLEQW